MLGESLVRLLPISGGTSGFCFIGELSGRRRFFKTYTPVASKQILEKEVTFLKAVTGDRSDASLLTVGSGEQAHTWLHMKVLAPYPALTPMQVQELVVSNEIALRSIGEIGLVPQDESLSLLLLEAKQALAVLEVNSLLSPDVRRQAQMCLARLESQHKAWPLQLCHGDLSPVNILGDHLGPLVVDWEDTFWSVAGYDYLYWLTFFENRKWLLPEVLGHTKLGHLNEIALMVAILLLKSMLSVRSGSYTRNSISFDQRLLEVMNLERNKLELPTYPAN
jgi:hypothetical protein